MPKKGGRTIRSRNEKISQRRTSVTDRGKEIGRKFQKEVLPNLIPGGVVLKKGGQLTKKSLDLMSKRTKTGMSFATKETKQKVKSAQKALSSASASRADKKKALRTLQQNMGSKATAKISRKALGKKGGPTPGGKLADLTPGQERVRRATRGSRATTRGTKAPSPARAVNQANDAFKRATEKNKLLPKTKPVQVSGGKSEFPNTNLRRDPRSRRVDFGVSSDPRDFRNLRPKPPSKPLAPLAQEAKRTAGNKKTLERLRKKRKASTPVAPVPKGKLKRPAGSSGGRPKVKRTPEQKRKSAAVSGRDPGQPTPKSNERLDRLVSVPAGPGKRKFVLRKGKDGKPASSLPRKKPR